MRSYKTQAIINWVRLFSKKGYWNYPTLVKYGLQWIKPIHKPTLKENSIYCIKEIGQTKRYLNKLGKFNKEWFQRLFEPETLGIRCWEYGVFLNYCKKQKVKWKKISLLDVGSGGSLMPDYLNSLGACVTSIDIEQPMEKRNNRQKTSVHYITGDMTKLDFEDNSFDITTCVSAIEHLDTDPEKKTFFSNKEYLLRSEKAIKEMVRVTKNNGVVYLTTDFYLDEQKTDNWPGSKDKIRGGYEWKYLNWFIEELEKLGVKTDFQVEKCKELLNQDKNYANYRGRYFTTAAITGIVKKNALINR